MPGGWLGIALGLLVVGVVGVLYVLLTILILTGATKHRSRSARHFNEWLMSSLPNRFFRAADLTGEQYSRHVDRVLSLLIKRQARRRHPPRSTAAQTLDRALEQCADRITRASRWLPAEDREATVATASDYVFMRARTPEEARRLTKTITWRMRRTGFKLHWKRVLVATVFGANGGAGALTWIGTFVGLTFPPVIIAAAMVVGGSISAWAVLEEALRRPIKQP